MFTLVGVGFGLLVFLVFLYWNRDKKSDQNESASIQTSTKQLQVEDIPGWNNPPAHESLGDTPVMAEHGSLHQYLLHRHMKEGPIIAFWMPGPQHVLSMASPELFRDTKKFFDRPECMLEIFRPLITSESIEFANYEEGRSRRRQYDPAFQHKAIRTYFNVFVECAEEFLVKYDEPKARESVSLKEDCCDLVLKAIFFSSFGNVFADEEEVKAFSAAYLWCWSDMEKRLGGDFPEKGSQREKEFIKGKNIIFAVLQRAIDARRDSSNTSESTELPFIDAALSAQYPDDVIQADMISYLIGALHASVFFMVWILYYLGTHPEVQEKVHSEISSTIGDGEVTFDSIKEMSYLCQVMDEVLRISALSPTAFRFPQEDTAVGDYLIPANTPIVHALGVVGVDGKFWDKPDVFDPERFSREASAKRGPVSFVPFGFGKRICPGYIFAYFEVGCFLAKVLKRYSVTSLTRNPGIVFGLVNFPEVDVFAKFTRH